MSDRLTWGNLCQYAEKPESASDANELGDCPRERLGFNMDRTQSTSPAGGCIADGSGTNLS
jgi:hypothetical protein